MANVTGKFLADFTSFYTAVEKADIKLKGMMSTGATVETRMNAVANSFAGNKIVQQATIATQAVNAIGGATTLTAKEQAKLNALVTEAIAKYKAMGQTAPKELTDIAAATAQIPKQLNLADQAMGVLKSSFGQFTLAGIATQAIGALTSEMSKFVGQGMKLPGLTASFQSLTTAAQVNGANMLAAMDTATKGLVSNYDLIQSANKAMLLGLPVTEQSMGELAQAATTLGRAMGQDATKSLDDLITALGRSSPMILDNLGLTVKVGEANEAYAATLGKTAEQLTDAEKKTAFYQAAMEAARKKTKELGDQSLTLSEIMGRAWTKIGDVVTSGAGAMNVAVGSLLTKQSSLVQFYKDVAGGMAPLQALARVYETQRAAQAAAAANRPAPTPDVPPPDKIRNYTAELERAAATMPKLTAATKAQYDAAVKLGETEENLTKRFGLSAFQQKQYADQQNETAKARKDAARDAARDLEKYEKEVVDRMLKNASIREDTNKRLQGSFEQLQASVAKNRIGEVLMADFAVIAPAMQTATEQMDRFKESNRALKVEAHLAGEALNDNAREARAFFQTLPNISKEFDKIIAGSRQLANAVGGSFGQMANAIIDVAAGAKAAKEGIEAMKAATQAKSAIEGIAGMASGVGAIASAAMMAYQGVKMLIGAFQDKGRDAVKKFAESYVGGFDEIHRQLLLMGDEGEKLWIKLTQGVDKKNAEQAARVIAEVEDALDRQADAARDAADTTQEEALATIESASEAQKALEQLTPLINTNMDTWKVWGDAVTGQIDRVAAALRELPILSGASAQQPPTGGSTAGKGAVGGMAVLNIDGRTVARAVVPQIPGVVQEYGLA